MDTAIDIGIDMVNKGMMCQRWYIRNSCCPKTEEQSSTFM